MNNKVIILLTVVVFLFLSMASGYAQHDNDHSEHKSSTHYYEHHFTLYNGLTTNLNHESTAYTVGVDYEFRFSKFVGIGILGEYVFTESGEFVTGIPLYAHPYKGAKIIVAPLIVIGEEEHEEHHDTKRESSFAFVVGAGYDFHMWKISVGPSINFGFSTIQTIGFGLSLGFGL